MEDTDKEKVSSPLGNPITQNDEQKPEDTKCGLRQRIPTEPTDASSTPPGNVVSESNLKTPTSHTGKTSRKKSNKSTRRGKKSSVIQGSNRYPLRSASRVQTNVDKKSDPPVPPPPPVNVVRGKKKKKRRKLKKYSSDEYPSIRNRVRYLLGKMNYEHSLIEAYTGEGWNGQSSEKVRPEREIERAKSAIISFKLKIRDQFQKLDSLLAEGRHEEILFDTEGQIDSEDIFCAKCGSKDLSINNDIILCDGICDRGFHQKCLNPPLLNDDIPSDDEGWLCPGCDCKVDCIDILNEIQGTDLAIEDTWENVFPEAASAAARNTMYDDYLGLPSEDSEDEDFAPGNNENSDQEAEESSSEGSGYTSEEPEVPAHARSHKNLELPSDDSEDDDFDPNKPESDVKSSDDGSGFNDSNCMSDSESFGIVENLISDAEKPLPPPTSEKQSGNGSSAKKPRKSSLKSELLSLLEDAGLDGTMLDSGKRERERLDYKKLHDETYGDNSSSSTDDENWTANTAKKIKSNTNVKALSSTKRCNVQNKKKNSKCSNGTISEKELSEKRQQSSEENQSPKPDRKQILVEELGLSPQQVNRWFSNSGHLVQTTIASRSGSRSRKLNLMDTSPKGSVSNKSKVSNNSSRKGKKVVQNLTASIAASAVTTVVKGEQSATPKKRGNKKNKVAFEKSTDGVNCELVHVKAEVVRSGSSEEVSKHVASSNIDREKLVRKELKRVRRK